MNRYQKGSRHRSIAAPCISNNNLLTHNIAKLGFSMVTGNFEVINRCPTGKIQYSAAHPSYRFQTDDQIRSLDLRPLKPKSSKPLLNLKLSRFILNQRIQHIFHRNHVDQIIFNGSIPRVIDYRFNRNFIGRCRLHSLKFLITFFDNVTVRRRVIGAPPHSCNYQRDTLGAGRLLDKKFK